MHALKCAHCGAKFEHKNPNVRVCSEKCRKARKRNQDIICKSGRSRIGHMEKCRYCGKQFMVAGTTQAFCSQKCRKANENRLKRAQDKTVPATCIICGCGFLASKNSKSKTCGAVCLTKYKSALTSERELKRKLEGGASIAGLFSMPCPWATPGKLGPGPEGSSWYSAQADPMTMGVWLTGNLETVRANEVTHD